MLKVAYKVEPAKRLRSIPARNVFILVFSQLIKKRNGLPVQGY